MDTTPIFDCSIRVYFLWTHDLLHLEFDRYMPAQASPWLCHYLKVKLLTAFVLYHYVFSYMPSASIIGKISTERALPCRRSTQVIYNIHEVIHIQYIVPHMTTRLKLYSNFYSSFCRCKPNYQTYRNVTISVYAISDDLNTLR